MGILVKLIGSGIGLASEAIHNRKLSNAVHKEAQAAVGQNVAEGSNSSEPRYISDAGPPEYVEVSEERGRELIAEGRALPVESKSGYPDEKAARNPYLNEGEERDDDALSEEGDEEVWQLDEASNELVGTPSEEQPGNPEDLNVLTDNFMRSHPPPAYYRQGQRSQLPCPVIIPQRRPGDKNRGFVRAYAPLLEDCDIDQATFLDFLNAFQASTKADKWLQVVSLSAAIVGFVPGPITMGVSAGVQVAVGIAMAVQRLARTNSFLDRMNNEFFKPRGLYCLIITYNPDATATHERIDINKTVMKYSTPATSGMRQTMRNLRGSSGKTFGELELPEAAPLVFPILDQQLELEGQKGQGSLKSVGRFIADYGDRRAQAKFAMESPNSKLAVGEGPVFHSRYADPSHPASSGSLVALLTGGHVNPAARRNARRIEKRQRKAWRRGDPIPDPSWKGKRNNGIVRRILKKNVLYLMIVNLPSEAEAQVGLDLVAREQQGQAPL